MEPRREEPQAPTPSPGEPQTPEERIAPTVRQVQPFRIQRLEERVAPSYYLKFD